MRLHVPGRRRSALKSTSKSNRAGAWGSSEYRAAGAGADLRGASQSRNDVPAVRGDTCGGRDPHEEREVSTHLRVGSEACAAL